jgi:hypothetical protein
MPPAPPRAQSKRAQKRPRQAERARARRRRRQEYITRTAHSEALIVRGTGCVADGGDKRPETALTCYGVSEAALAPSAEAGGATLVYRAGAALHRRPLATAGHGAELPLALLSDRPQTHERCRPSLRRGPTRAASEAERPRRAVSCPGCAGSPPRHSRRLAAASPPSAVAWPSPGQRTPRSAPGWHRSPRQTRLQI